MDRRYIVKYRDGSSQIVNGTIVFFDYEDTGTVNLPDNIVYLNINEVLSLVEHKK